MKDIAYKHALLNAIDHEGKADFQAVLGKVLMERPELKKKIKEIIPEIKEIVKDVNSHDVEEQKSLLNKLGVQTREKVFIQEGLPDLPNKKKKIVMRMAPYPSGPLHIGNARMVILNDEYVKRHKGKLFLVFDDTIGSENKFAIPEAYKMIADDLKWLGVKYHKTFYKSKRLGIFYRFATELIKKKFAYVCECSAEALRNNRIGGVVCKHRNQSEKENMKKWTGMMKGKYKEGGATLRLKTDMQHPNPAFRDRVLFRISERKHPKTGKKYKVWPMLEFSWAVDDHLLGITHILRGKDLVIEDMMEEFVWNLLGWEKPEILHYGILNLEGLKLSKTESRRLIGEKTYSGWDDPRTWSLKSLRKRGVQPDAIRNFVVSMGLSLADVKVPVEILYAENRKLIDGNSNRYFAVFEPVPISVKNAKVKATKAPLHPNLSRKGMKKIPVDVKKIYVERRDFESFHGKEVGLMNLFTISMNKNADVVSQDVKYEVQKVHWVSEPNVKIKVVMPNGMEKKALAEPSIKNVKVNETVQFQRIGFARLDKKGKEPVFYFSHK